ncbi:family 5 carbohydrate esterase [Fusarium flagelliforme]|uniref:Family 5 carbohydrate esterase n=2 Tax=Fusarium flagelliforme TaxID=2675880 RepID=A0A395MGC7_9HYPO|nr:family 5 carbohydrate esterase [Fusarium flagelliforme]
MVSPTFLFLSTLSGIVAVASADSGCRCGDSAYLAIPRVNLSTPEQLKPCAAYKLLDARGSGEPQGVSLMFQNTIERILANNTGAVSQAVIYPAGFDQNVTAGVNFVTNVIKYGLQDCPKQKYFLFGYSQGATVVQKALNELDDTSIAAVSSIVMVGNPYRMPGRFSNVDSQGHHDNRTANGLFTIQSLQSNDSIPTFNESLDRSGKVADICLENDIVCSFDPECKCQLASDHLSYGLMKPVQDQIFNHVVSRF